MTTGWPRPSENFWTTTRATLSLDPPGGNGTTRRIGRIGYVWACSASANAIPAMHAAKRTRLRRRTRPLASAEFVSDDQAAFHHEPDSFHFGDVLERVSGDRNDVRELAFFDGPYVVFPPVVQHPGGRKKRLPGGALRPRFRRPTRAPAVQPSTPCLQ